ncbi:MAG: GNAT family N-acetyltransferase [Chloroflexi bacterium RBG_16_54_11]|nr:MAG: GNAT family N-acetyltransferase [Chloroflexi bacterium RBG_16_54_11]
MLIRNEEPKDYLAVHRINASAFTTPAEADLVDVLRKEAYPTISLIAEENGEPVGHIMFSPVTLSGDTDLLIMGLGPMAVVSEQQSKGIGSTLVRIGLEKCKQLGYGAVVVLGHPWFYPRFGFLPSLRFGIDSEYDVPEEIFMVIELEPGYLQGASGTIRYHPAFSGV